ncbi:MAG: esterase [Chloroflexota bacterium]|nr:esterase [Chloroflexota bacterium]
MPNLITTLGPLGTADLGMILPHEHVFVDLRTWDQPGYGEAETDDVIRLMAPEIEAVRAAGVTAIVEPGPVGVGRRADILMAVSHATGFPLAVPTGVYREPWLPPWARDATEADLRDWMIGELTGQIEESGVQAAWIKVGATDDGVTNAEAKVLRAAAAASIATGAAIGSHTVRGHVARSQLDLIEAEGAPADCFIWIHAHQEPDIAIHHELGRRGAWIEYDGIGSPGDDARFIDLVRRGLEAGLVDRILLSQDRGWYDPAQPVGGTPKPFTYLPERFLPQLADAGVDDGTIDRLMRHNPFTAFAR